MQHSTDDLWVDFVRGSLALDDADTVDQHLKSGSRHAMRARLRFDSLRGANLVGVRGVVPLLLRHLLYQAGSLSIDFTIEPRANANELALTGQVIDTRRVAIRAPRSRAPRPKILLLQGDRKLATTVTNRVGEFELQFEPQDGLALIVLVKGRPPVLVDLSEVLGRRDCRR